MKLINIFALFLLASCAAIPVGPKSTEINKISLGMSKTDVISTIGQPSRVSANNGVTYLIYLLVDDVDYTQSSITLGLAPPQTSKSEYFVKLQNNSVVSYGKAGDFSNTIEPTNDNHKKTEKYAQSAAYALGCTQKSPGQYNYIEKALSDIRSGLRKYLKENPEQIAHMKEVASIKNDEFKNLSTNESNNICNKINDIAKNTYYPTKN